MDKESENSNRRRPELKVDDVDMISPQRQSSGGLNTASFHDQINSDLSNRFATSSKLQMHTM